ncbi:hypothetical protein AFULGI_00018480 [Archaeoglobus fulgidus DSM 8774]|uniref:DUF4234 domain-containing protein n=1 Tax=Archaeoglobus fulgidus DSM 8774 TaxID=1344584 RepID=A0A075WM65_ARCFL|nr:DUF4234 domain-containing protein [Archaeoglobus fulgidus]AIG98603.1 hypothetical protein AFULGI_00018480 [Archaeoglobus fulgidus DSM 8774]
MVTKRSLLKLYLLGIVTLGIYFIYWLVMVKRGLNSLGANIPTCWLLIIPIANIYWLYKFAEGFVKVLKPGESAVLYFLLFWLVSIIMPAIVQSELNKLAERGG